MLRRGSPPCALSPRAVTVRRRGIAFRRPPASKSSRRSLPVPMIRSASLRLRRLVPSLGLAAAVSAAGIMACRSDRKGGEVIQAGEAPTVGTTLFTRLPASLTGVQF